MRKRNRKSQVTIFLLLCVIFAIVIGIVQMNERMKNPSLEQTIELSAQDIPVKKWVDGCIELAALSTAARFGIRQGFYDFPPEYLPTEWRDFNYYALNEKNIMPTNSIFSNELAAMMDEELLNQCTDFSVFSEKGYQISWQKPKTNAVILEDKVLFDISFPVLIQKELLTRLDGISYVLPYRIGHSLNASRILVDSAIGIPTAVDTTLPSLLDLGVMIVEYDSCNHLYFLLDNQSRLSGEKGMYLHTFAIGFSKKFCSEVGQSYSINKNETALLAEWILEGLKDQNYTTAP